MAVVSFHRAIATRAERVGYVVRANEQTVTLASGRMVAQCAHRVTSSDRLASAMERELGAFFNDAERSGVPARIAKAAWHNFREAKNALEQCENLAVRYRGEYGDCRALELLHHGAAVGGFSILDANTPRSTQAIANDISRLLGS